MSAMQFPPEMSLKDKASDYETKQYDAILEQAGIGLWQWDIQQQQFTLLSGQCSHMLDHSTSELQQFALQWKEWVHPDEWELMENLFAALAKGQLSFEISLRILSGEGQYKWMKAAGVFDQQTGVISGTLTDASTHQTLNEELRESEVQYQTIYENSTIGMMIVDRDGTIIRINPALYQMLEYSSAEIVGNTIMDFIHRADADEYYRNFNELVAGNINDYRLEARFRTRNKRTIWCDMQVNAVFSDNQELNYVVGQLQDITHRKDAILGLEASRNQFKALYDIAADYYPNFDAQIEHVLRSAVEILGMQIGIVSEIQNDNYVVENVYDEKERIKRGDAFKLSNTFCDLTLKEKKIVDIFNTKRTKEYSGHPCFDAFDLKSYIGAPLTVNGKLYGTLNFSSFLPKKKNFTEDHRSFIQLLSRWVGRLLEKKHAEEALTLSEQRQAAMLKGMPDLMLRVDSEGTFIDYYARNEEDFAIAPSKFVGKNMFAVFPKVIAETQFLPVQRAIETGEVQTYSYQLPNQKSVIKDFEARVVKTSEKEVVVIIRDVTNIRKIMEAETLDQELERFAYIASHDLKEPLRSIGSFSELLKENHLAQLDEEGQTFVNFIAENSQRMDEMIQGILIYSRLGLRMFEPRIFDMNNALHESLGLLDEKIRAHQALIRYDELPKKVQGDYSQYVKLFTYLIDNAIKFRKPDIAPQIEIRLHEENFFYQISIKDNGLGFSPDQYVRIFEIFSTLNMRDQYDGIGMGLAYCKRILRNHNGEIWVESKPGTGSTFFFKFPKEQNFDF